MQKKKWILWGVIIVLLIAGFVVLYSVPIPRGYFRTNEQIEFHYIIKTTPDVPEGQTVERYDNVDFSSEDILEYVDTEKLNDMLPMMRVSLYKEYLGSHWVGDVVYEIDGHFTSGLRKGQFFHILLGTPEESHLRTHSGQRGYIIYDSESWLQIMAMLEQ